MLESEIQGSFTQNERRCSYNGTHPETKETRRKKAGKKPNFEREVGSLQKE
ncbi:MAG: hypothetical protein PHP96_00520 [Candidatus Dojkabacteria bacterium]|jgi:hypothetical protein|nr:hypothetical protein [Candidatus Dojkabacteria bacterium]MDD4561328.1 hypothetical protein [Candidatus Dojkabacteria bacterium]NLB11893.1 hypothetical protein [Candidatus Dojkabacteria bacterium]